MWFWLRVRRTRGTEAAASPRERPGVTKTGASRPSRATGVSRSTPRDLQVGHGAGGRGGEPVSRTLTLAILAASTLALSSPATIAQSGGIPAH